MNYFQLQGNSIELINKDRMYNYRVKMSINLFEDNMKNTKCRNYENSINYSMCIEERFSVMVNFLKNSINTANIGLS